MSAKPKLIKPNDAAKPKKTPRSQPLPGAEGVRLPELDTVAEEIADCRAELNAARQDELSWITKAHRLMQDANVTAYKHAGVELVRVPGDEKLRVRSLKDKGENAQ